MDLPGERRALAAAGRVVRLLSPFAGLVFFGLALWALYWSLRDYHYREIVEAFRALPAARVASALGLTAAARLAQPGQGPRPEQAAATDAGSAFRLRLAHNPKLAPLAEKAGFDVQLSGHTHAGQFFPWTLAIRLVHAPHVAGLVRTACRIARDTAPLNFPRLCLDLFLVEIEERGLLPAEFVDGLHHLLEHRDRGQRAAPSSP